MLEKVKFQRRVEQKYSKRAKIDKKSKLYLLKSRKIKIKQQFQ